MISRKRRFFQYPLGLLLLLVFLTACDKGPRLDALPPDAVILAFGDSLTWGTGAGREEAYPAVLGRRLQRRVINAGVPGEISGEGLARLPGLLAEHRPDLLILCHGGNDFLQRRDPETVRENIRRMLDLAREAGTQAVLIGVPPPGLFLSAAPLYEEMAGEYRIPYEGEALAEILAERNLKSDTIHPNAAGYRQLAESLGQLIEKAQR